MRSVGEYGMSCGVWFRIFVHFVRPIQCQSLSHSFNIFRFDRRVGVTSPICSHYSISSMLSVSPLTLLFVSSCP
jgi:hypothetical protein